MTVDKLSVSFERDLARAVRAAAEMGGGGLSRWLAQAATARLRSDALGQFLQDWQATHGSLTPEELETAAAELGIVGAAGGATGSTRPAVPPTQPPRRKVAGPPASRRRRSPSTGKA